MQICFVTDIEGAFFKAIPTPQEAEQGYGLLFEWKELERIGKNPRDPRATETEKV